MSGRSAGFDFCCMCMLYLWICLSDVAGQDPVGYRRAMQGPMIGAVSEDSALIWGRFSYAFPVQVEYSTKPDFSEALRSETLTARKERDYCLTFRLDGLQPKTRYYYRFVIDEERDKYRDGKPPWSFQTAPGSASSFRIAFGSCARWQREPEQPIWKVIPEFKPDAFFWLGDNVYADSLDPDILAEELLRQREVPHIQSLLAETPQLAIWDDHDFGLNNHDRTNPMKEGALEVWKRLWPNPAFGLPETPGVFFKYEYGGVDFFFLDGRYYRDPNSLSDDGNKTMLGQEQVEWLKRNLSASRAKFKVLVSGGTWTTSKGEGGDAWSSYQTERDRLFDWIMAEKIGGVILLSGDTHTGELNVARWSERGGYDLYDFVASPLAQEPENGWLFRNVEQRIQLPYDLGPNFGLLDFDMGEEEPTVTLQLITLESKPAWRPVVLKASELQPGVSSWKAKQSKDAGRWMRYLNQLPSGE